MGGGEEGVVFCHVKGCGRDVVVVTAGFEEGELLRVFGIGDQVEG